MYWDGIASVNPSFYYIDLKKLLQQRNTQKIHWFMH